MERLDCCAHTRRRFVKAQRVQLTGKIGRADIALNLINKPFGVERDLEDNSDQYCKAACLKGSQPLLAQLRSWVKKTQSQVTMQNALGKAIAYLASNCSELEREVEHGLLPIGNDAAEHAIRR